MNRLTHEIQDTPLAKIRLGSLDAAEKVVDLEREAGELCAIFAAISLKVAARLERQKPSRR